MDKIVELSDLFPVFSLEKEMVALGTRAKALRRRKGYTQAELSDRSGVSLGSLKRFERTGEISLRSLWKIAQSLGCEKQLEELFLGLLPTRKEIWGEEDE